MPGEEEKEELGEEAEEIALSLCRERGIEGEVSVSEYSGDTARIEVDDPEKNRVCIATLRREKKGWKPVSVEVREYPSIDEEVLRG